MILLLSCSLFSSEPPPPLVVDRSEARVSLGAPEGVERVDVVAFSTWPDGRWALAGVADDQRWAALVAADGTVAHHILGPGRIQDADAAPDGTLWMVGFDGAGAPWVGALEPSGSSRVDARFDGGTGGELWAVRATSEGAHALGMYVPLVLGRADAWWLELDRSGAPVAERRGRGFGYAYAFDLDVTDDAALAVGMAFHKGQLYRPSEDRLENEPSPIPVVALYQVRRGSGGWWAAGEVKGLDERLKIGRLALVWLPDDGEAEVVATSAGPAGTPSSLYVTGDDVWLHTIKVRGLRFEPTGHRVLRRQGDALVPVGEEHPGFGALALGADGTPWRASWTDGAVWVERLEE